MSRAGRGGIVFWAWLGVIATLFSTSVFGQWLLSAEHFAPVAITAADAITDAQRLRLRLLEAISMLVTVAGLCWYLLRPALREGRVTIEGLLLVGALISYVLDTTINYSDYVMAWNKHALNFGTWAAFFPGHTGPTAYAEALFWGPPMYVYFGVLLAALQLASIRGLRRMGLGFGAALAGAFVVAFAFDLVVESLIIQATEAYAWPRTIGSLSLWAGTQAQFPLYESLFVAIYATMYTLLMRSADNDPDGLTWIERGVHRLPRGLRLPSRLMAATGFATLCTMIYFSGFYLFSMHADSVVALPSYLMPAVSP